MHFSFVSFTENSRLIAAKICYLAKLLGFFLLWNKIGNDVVLEILLTFKIRTGNTRKIQRPEDASDGLKGQYLESALDPFSLNNLLQTFMQQRISYFQIRKAKS